MYLIDAAVLIKYGEENTSALFSWQRAFVSLLSTLR